MFADEAPDVVRQNVVHFIEQDEGRFEPFSSYIGDVRLLDHEWVVVGQLSRSCPIQ
jgi:hypothetical protein